MADTPRVLRISFEFHVHRKLSKNIHTSRVNKALDTIADRVLGLAEGLFPWAHTVTVHKEWLYNWTDNRYPVTLPATADNTPDAQ
ncbi:hypothetical protein ACIG5E_36470 [Kitasatospora sp. NPDC053057]|uniref:hypothetical protein n=1 Tax=Kitasatospora sp. NPDC053057 TaxID=3364062 RepID=UPI0037CB7B7A